MLRVNQINVSPDADMEIIRKKTASILGLKNNEIDTIRIIKQSIDARKKPTIFFSYTVDVILKKEFHNLENKILRRSKTNQVSHVSDKPYQFPKAGNEKLLNRPVIIGMGPAGLFCGYMLAQYGYCPIILERGKDVDSRTKDVKEFWENGTLNTNSNVQFGEGGAGTFSDGKLNTLIKDKDGRNKEVLRIFVEHGAPSDILYHYKPHIGTDILRNVVKSMRKSIIDMGGEVHFHSEMNRLLIENGRIKGVEIIDENQKCHSIFSENVVLAIGHSARNTFKTLYHQNIPMEAKAFAVGFRVEHPQKMINMEMYGMEENSLLGAASYKVTAKTTVGRGVYSFCMCPGGYVVNASSEEGMLAVNGMSYSDRASENANSAVIVSVTPDDYGSNHPLAGIEFQQNLERKAFEAGGGCIPIERYGSFYESIMREPKEGFESMKNMSWNPCTKGAYQFSDLTKILPPECNQAFVEGMELFSRQIAGFNHPDTLLLAVESRTSSPVRIHRGEDLQSEIRGLYPCGEGAGYAGGITSAAMDGIRVAEEIAKHFQPISCSD